MLWQALKDGVIDFVATDHSPSTPELNYCRVKKTELIMVIS